MGNVRKNQNNSRKESYREDIEPRDKEVLVDSSSFFVSGNVDDRSLKKWTTEVFKRVFSVSFNHLSRDEMNFEQAKIFCS